MNEITKTHTFCHICEQTCGLEVESADNRILSVGPDKQNPWGWRDFCVKAARATDVVHHKARITQPMRRVGDQFITATYEEAIEDIASRLLDIIDKFGPDAVGVYTGNPAGTVFGGRNFLGAMLDAIGTKSRFTVGSIDQNAWHVVMDALYGNPWIPLIPDIDRCDCFMFIGANPAISMMNWLGKVPDGWRRTLSRVADGADLIVVDPRLTETARKATLHIVARPEQDWALLLGVLQIIFTREWVRPDHLGQIENLSSLKELALAVSLQSLAQRCDVTPETIVDISERLTRAEHPIVISRTGPAMGRNGVITQWLEQAINLVLGNIDVPGGRYMPAWPVNFPAVIEKAYPPSHGFSRVRGLPRVAGGLSLAELPDEILTPGAGQVRAFMLYGGNIVNSAADGAAMERALQELDLFVSIDLFQRESHRFADWLIPGVHFLERTELGVMFWSLCDRPYIQACRAAVEPPDGVMQEWAFFLALGRRMGLQMFSGDPDPTPEKISRYMLDIENQVDYDEVMASPHGVEYGQRSFGHLWKYLATKGAKVDICPQAFAALLEACLKAGLPEADAEYPFQMIGRRRINLMNSSLSDTVGILGSDVRSDVIEISLADAERLGLQNLDHVSVSSRVGAIEARVLVTKSLRDGVVVMEHGWGSRLFNPMDGSVATVNGVNRNLLVATDDLAPLSAVPRLNGTPVAVTKIGSPVVTVGG